MGGGNIPISATDGARVGEQSTVIEQGICGGGADGGVHSSYRTPNSEFHADDGGASPRLSSDFYSRSRATTVGGGRLRLLGIFEFPNSKPLFHNDDGGIGSGGLWVRVFRFSLVHGVLGG